MPSASQSHAPTLLYTDEPDGRSTRIEVMVGDHSVSRLWVVRQEIHIGASRVRMDGIGGVGTSDEHRNRGYSRLALEAAVRHMTAGDAAISMLYGIRDFYPKFGYVTAGPEHSLELSLDAAPTALPHGWLSRPFRSSDAATVRRIHHDAVALSTGAAVRKDESYAWSQLVLNTAPDEAPECLVVVSPEGVVEGYAWHGAEFWSVGVLERDVPEAFILAEVMASTSIAADAVLAACCGWAAKSPHAKRFIRIPSPPDTLIASAAMRLDCRFVCDWTACGGSMARMLNPARLLTAMLPEFARCMKVCGQRAGMTIALNVDGAIVSLAPSDDAGFTVTMDGVRDTEATQLSGQDLARLALGAYPPDSILDGMPTKPCADARATLCTLFPQRRPHMYLPDRY